MSNELNHIAIIMDGNGRWSTTHNTTKLTGYKKGADNAKRIIGHCIKKKIKYLTLYAFSSDNWKRPKNEVADLMKLFKIYLNKEMQILQTNNIKFTTIGRINDFSSDIQQSISKIEKSTENNSAMHLNIALSYGGKLEIIDACNLAMQDSNKKSLTLEDINNNLYAPEVPEVDLMIRTSGEKRLSDFMLWRSSYAELYFTDILWPDFNEACLDEAIKEFYGRTRNFGRSREDSSP